MDPDQAWEKMEELEKTYKATLGQNPLRVFISYSTEDGKEIAGAFKRSLTDFELNVFLAHEDMPAGKEFEKGIIKEIQKTDVFIPIITKGFMSSHYCDQETGIAVGCDSLIVPVKVDLIPQGFINRIHAIKTDRERFIGNITHGSNSEGLYLRNKPHLMQNVKQIFQRMLETPLIKDRTLNTLVEGIYLSGSFKETEDKIDVLEGVLDHLNPQQLNNLALGGIRNSQVNQCFRAQNVLRKVFSEKRELLELSLLANLKSEKLTG